MGTYSLLLDENNFSLLSEQVHDVPRLDALHERYLLLDAVPLEV